MGPVTLGGAEEEERLTSEESPSLMGKSVGKEGEHLRLSEEGEKASL